MDTVMQQQLIDGMVTRGKALRADEAIFIEAKGLSKTIEKTRNQREENQALLEAEKEELKRLKADKVKAVSGITAKIIEKMNEVLPEKNGFFDCSDGLVMGLTDDRGVIPLNGLSGAELQLFSTAISNVLSADFIIIECAELDNNRMSAMIEDLSLSDKQIILNTHIPPYDEKEYPNNYRVSDNFKVVNFS